MFAAVLHHKQKTGKRRHTSPKAGGGSYLGLLGWSRAVVVRL